MRKLRMVERRPTHAASLVAGGAAVAAAAFALADWRWPALAAILLALAAGALAWRDARARERRVRGDARRREEQLEATIRERERERDAEREERARVERSRRTEREWNRELRAKIAELQRELGTLGGEPGDVRTLVLRTAMALVGAEKGLLLSREDEDSDGLLDLVAAEGFEHDPADSAIAQHFAEQVIERDRTVRADDPAELVAEKKAPADEEIENLVAIPIYMRDRFHGAVVAANKPGSFQDFDDEVLLSLGDHAGAVLHNARLRGELRGSYLTTVRVLADALEAKDRELRTHSNQVSSYVAGAAARLGLEPRKREELIFASLLHDIGKIGISERILLKAGPLTPEERLLVELHPRIGFRLVDQIPALRGIAPAILHHHERWDGDGYPAKLRGEDIPVEARLIGVADAFSSMTSNRPYRSAMSLEEACDELKRCAGTQFDPTIVRYFIDEIRARPPDPEAGEPDVLSLALDDPELDARRAHDERLLGESAFSVVDNLTLLYSHRHLHEVAKAEASRAEVQDRPFGAIVVQLQELAEVNRDRGYAAGDDAIRAVAEAVERIAARAGGTAARESGRRIALVVPGADEEIARKLCEELASQLDGQGVAAGCAAWRKGDSGDDVLARATADARNGHGTAADGDGDALAGRAPRRRPEPTRPFERK